MCLDLEIMMCLPDLLLWFCIFCMVHILYLYKKKHMFIYQHAAMNYHADFFACYVTWVSSAGFA